VWLEKVSLSDCAATRFLLCIFRSVTQCLGACLSCWITLAQDRDKWQDAVNVGSDPLGSIKLWEFLDCLGFLRNTLLHGVN